jgi:hypothetical protein
MKKPRETERPVDYLPWKLLEQSFKGYERNNFFLFLRSLIGEDAAIEQVKKYHIGTSRHWQGANVFWQVDKEGRVRQLKLMLYNPETGKRLKSEDQAMKWDYISEKYREDIGGNDKSLIYGKYIQERKFKDYNLQQCFFGEHLLRDKGPIALVESEKTCIVGSHYFKDFIWIATGGSNGAGFTKPEVCRVLKGREIVLFPDLCQFEKWTEKARELERIIPCKIVVSDLLETHAGPEERAKGLDLADYLITNNGPKNLAKKVLPSNGRQWIPIDGVEGF